MHRASQTSARRKGRAHHSKLPPPLGADSPYWNLEQAAAAVGVSQSTIRLRLWKGQLRRFRFIGRTLVLKSEILAMVQEVAPGSVPQPKMIANKK
jgi:hypothetical protein